MIHTTSLTRPVQKKYVLINVILKGAETALTGLLEYSGGGYDGRVKVMDKVITGWGQRLSETQQDLSQKAQSYIDSMGLREGQLQGTYA